MTDQEKKDLPELISSYQFAELHGVHAQTIYNKIKKGEIKTTPMGKYKFIDHKKYADIEFPRAVHYKK